MTKQYLIAVKLPGKKAMIWAFEDKHDRAMFLDALARSSNKKVDYALTER